jgi:hypothetical protein
MKIAIFGSGYVGLETGACLPEAVNNDQKSIFFNKTMKYFNRDSLKNQHI